MGRESTREKAELDWFALAALALFGLLTPVLTWPLPFTMDRSLAGYSVDVYINPWADWWTKKALIEGLDFYHTDYMFYPRGASLVFHSFSHVNTFISLLLTPLVGHFVAYNVVILLAYVLSGFSMYLLAHYLTGCRPAALISGLLFAFCPYHMFESAHPVLVTTQWMPLFAMALMRTIHDPDAGRIRQPLLAGCWFLLTALSSWHLMVMLIGWTALYLLYSLLYERSCWSPQVWRSLLLLAIVAGLSVTPFLWPIIREQLAKDTTYMAVETDEGLGNDLVSFFIPNRRHPVFSSYFTNMYDASGFVKKRPAYLGYVPLGLTIAGTVAVRRKTRFWLLAGSFVFVLSLGSNVTFNGSPLHTFQLPWAIPIISLLRHPFRLNTLLFFSLAILVGFGCRELHDWIARRNKVLAGGVLALVAGFMLFEYLVIPFPTTQPLPSSPFFAQLAQEEGNFAVADFPMGRKQAKYYLFYQTIHGKKMVDGVVSRTPDDAYAFVDASPLLGALRALTAPAPDLDIKEQFAILAAQDIRYIILHKHLLEPGELENWQKWLSNFPAPFYEDEWLIVYRTTSAQQAEIP